MKRWYPFAYYVTSRSDRVLLPFQLRDGHGALYLCSVLAALGYELGTVIFNPPGDTSSENADHRIPVDRSFLRPQDLIVIPTRPPLDDIIERAKKRIAPSFTDLEEDLFKALRTVFKYCSRTQLTLTDAIVRRWPEVRDHQNILFQQNNGARYESYGALGTTTPWRRPEKGKYVTAAYLAYVEHAWEGGPGLLTAFGMGGTETLGWCSLLATRFSHLVRSTPFAMVEIIAKDPPTCPHTMDFVDRWEVKLLAPGDVAKMAYDVADLGERIDIGGRIGSEAQPDPSLPHPDSCR